MKFMHPDINKLGHHTTPDLNEEEREQLCSPPYLSSITALAVTLLQPYSALHKLNKTEPVN